MVTVELTDYEAQAFTLFQKYRDLFEFMDAAGALDIKSGRVVIHFSKLGGVVSIEKNEHFIPGDFRSY